MPLFKKIKLFFIHIPKTGGTSVDDYLYRTTNTPKTIESIFSWCRPIKFNKHSLQHCTYEELVKYGECLNLDINKYKLITIVRNPYNRIVSELFYLGRIDMNSSTKFVEKKIIEFLQDDYHYDNHRIPQYKFLIYKNKLVEDITIFRNETLTEDMRNYGFKDFDENANKTFRDKIDYMSLLSVNAKNIIYDYYKKDFELFNYEK